MSDSDDFRKKQTNEERITNLEEINDNVQNNDLPLIYERLAILKDDVHKLKEIKASIRTQTEKMSEVPSGMYMGGGGRKRRKSKKRKSKKRKSKKRKSRTRRRRR